VTSDRGSQAALTPTCEASPDQAWAAAVLRLLETSGSTFGLFVRIENPTGCSGEIRARYEDLARSHRLLNVRQVAYTIFPQSLYEKSGRSTERLFERYNRPGGAYDRVKAGRWGTYFRRMTHQEVAVKGSVTVVNQLRDLIQMLRERPKVYKAAYSIAVARPGDSRRTMGGPCLDHICLQLDRHGGRRTLSLLALYRSQNFVQRALGNYVGLGQLQAFLCEQTGYEMGRLSVVASHATIEADSPSRVSWPTRPELRRLCEAAMRR